MIRVYDHISVEPIERLKVTFSPNLIREDERRYSPFSENRRKEKKILKYLGYLGGGAYYLFNFFVFISFFISIANGEWNLVNKNCGGTFGIILLCIVVSHSTILLFYSFLIWKRKQINFKYTVIYFICHLSFLILLITIYSIRSEQCINYMEQITSIINLSNIFSYILLLSCINTIISIIGIVIYIKKTDGIKS